MGDGLLEGGAAQGLVAALAPPFDGEIVEAGLREMMGDDFWRGCGALGLIAQDFRGAAVQRLAAAFQQAVVRRVLDQRVLEAIVRLMARAFGDEEVRAGEPIERRLERGVVDLADRTQQRIGEISPQDGADLCDLARFAEPVEPVMFCDLVGSTALASRLDTEDWRSLVNAYLDKASGVIGRRSAETSGDLVGADFDEETATSAGGFAPANAAIASSNRNRSPSAETPISLRSSAVSRGSMSASILLSRKLASYWPRPRPRSHPPTSMAALHMWSG